MKAAGKKSYRPRAQANEEFDSMETSANISHWVLQTIKRVSIQFRSRPPRFMGVFSTRCPPPQQVLVMEQEVKALLEKGAIEYVPHSNRETEFYSWYFMVPEKDGGCVPF